MGNCACSVNYEDGNGNVLCCQKTGAAESSDVKNVDVELESRKSSAMGSSRPRPIE